MVFHMKTTLNIDDTVMRRLKEEAARRDCTMSELVEAGLRRILDEPKTTGKKSLPPLPSKNMGKPLIDIDDKEALRDYLDADTWKELYGVDIRPGKSR